MGKIDTSEWGTFKVGDLFDAERGKVKNLQLQPSGNTPVIAAGGFNQGIAGMYDVPATYKNKITISCNGAGCGSVFYHAYGFNLNGDAIVLTERIHMSDLSKQFISCMLNGVLTRKYSYEEKCSADKVKNETIMLPIDKDGNPNWNYMNEYMRDIEARTCDKISRLERAIRYRGCAIDVSNWKGFKVGELFDIVKLKKKMSNSDLSDNGTVPVYSSTTANNGIFGYTFNDPLYHISDSIPYYVLFGDHTKSMFIVKNDFNTMDNVKILKPRIFNEYATKFILTSWLKSIPNLGYSRHWLIAKNCEIYLPSDKYGKPDYLYMQNYMLNIEKQMTEKLTLIL